MSKVEVDSMSAERSVDSQQVSRSQPVGGPCLHPISLRSTLYSKVPVSEAEMQEAVDYLREKQANGEKLC